MRSLLIVLAMLNLAAPAAAAPRALEEAFLEASLVPGPQAGSLLVRSYADRDASSTYDAALAALWLLERGRRDEAGRLLAGVAALQHDDGALPFSFALPAPAPGVTYVRSGAIAWVGYAAARYLNDAADGPHRPAIAEMAHRLAGYLLSRRVEKPGDRRDGLVTGGAGRYRHEITDTGIVETLEPGELNWASTEHNIDVYFFWRELGLAARNERYRRAADNLAGAIVARLWDDRAGQFHQGVDRRPDPTRALDCASWGAIFLQAIGDPVRARRSYQAAERLYAVTDASRQVAGHKPYAERALIESRALADYFAEKLPAQSWRELAAVWPEGSAGVALAALRLGEVERARTILAELDRLRGPEGGLPCLTVEIPMEFASAPALAGTAWVALVRAELESSPAKAMIWRR